MDRNTIIGLLLIFAIIVGYSWWTSPSAEEREKMLREKEMQEQVAAEILRQDSLAHLTPTEKTTEEIAETPEKQDVLDTNKLSRDVQNVFWHALKEGTNPPEPQITRLETDVFAVDFNNLGGTINRVNLKKYPTWTQDSLYLFDQKWQDFYISFFVNNRLIDSKDYYFEMTGLPQTASITGDETAKISMRLYASSGDEGTDRSRYIEFVYGFKGNDYMIDFQINFVGMNHLITNRTSFIDLHWNARLPRNEKAPNLEDPNTAIYYKPASDKVDYLSETRDDKESFKTPLTWVAFKHHFFSSVLMMKDQPMLNADLANFVEKNLPADQYVKTLDALIGLPYSAEEKSSIDMQLFLGPNKYNTLAAYDKDLERLIPIGWSFFLMHWVNRFAVIPIFNFLEKMDVGYGAIILILTILLKIILSPITAKSYISSAKMRVIKPEVDELSKKYPKPEQAMDKQKAMMALYKKAGINQLAGCIPMLVQFPILIAMFRFFPASIELRQQSFLWADDLSSYDSVLSLPFNIPFYGDHVSLFALLMAVSNLFYTRMTMKQQSSSMAMPGMKVMMYIMPIMFLGFLNSFSAALNYYYFLSTCMTFLITWVIGKFINEEKIHRMIAEARKKPVTKSKFQQRVEAMAKKQQEMQRQQRRGN